MNADSSAQPDLGAIEARLAANRRWLHELEYVSNGCLPLPMTQQDIDDIAALLARCRALEAENAALRAKLEMPY